MEQDRKAMRRLIIAINNIDELYYNDTAKIGIKESLLWLLYALDNGQAHSQKYAEHHH